MTQNIFTTICSRDRERDIVGAGVSDKVIPTVAIRPTVRLSEDVTRGKQDPLA